mmetsp:Transcript_54678/g.122745  ORF Transcript_54678/g.122745 Transcript_54678/m.122745 type:complete len:298 (-) Transcript_54678:147-1040(-)
MWALRNQSRSPRRVERHTTEWISRRVASFGRYEERRPPGLVLDEHGTFYLDDLMMNWGHAEGLTEEMILSALQRHMFSSDHGTAQIRFTLGADAAGRHTIRVTPPKKRDRPERFERRGFGRALEYRSSSPRPSGKGLASSRTSAFRFTSPRQTGMPLRGSVLRAVIEHKKRSTQQKLDMSLDEVIRADTPMTSIPARGAAGLVVISDQEDNPTTRQKHLEQRHTGLEIDKDVACRQDSPYESLMLAVSSPMQVKPPPPPGEHWTEYKDEFDDQAWFHYDGPLGQFWSVGGAVLPFDK